MHDGTSTHFSLPSVNTAVGTSPFFFVNTDEVIVTSSFQIRITARVCLRHLRAGQSVQSLGAHALTPVAICASRAPRRPRGAVVYEGNRASGPHVAFYGSELIDRVGDTRVGARTLTSARESAQVSSPALQLGRSCAVDNTNLVTGRWLASMLIRVNAA